MANSYGQFTLWVSVSYVVKSEPSCTSHKPRASYQRWLVRGDLEHEICPHAAIQSYAEVSLCTVIASDERKPLCAAWAGFMLTERGDGGIAAAVCR